MRKIIMIFAMICFAVPALAYDNVDPVDAFYLTAGAPNVFILDVRTAAEWTWVGHPGVNKNGEGYPLEGKVINASVMIDDMNELVENPNFIASVESLFPDKANVILITMCRSGGRSIAAAEALEAAGYLNVMNMLTGFEGGKDSDGYRTVNGWKNDGLPYNHSSIGAYVVESQCQTEPTDKEKLRIKIKSKLKEILTKHGLHKRQEKYQYKFKQY